ncbi:MAG: RNA methyltransferase [Tissierellia bacterium]|nr:RNA methyltransferase [Tissierellia bacterium]
MTDRILSSNTNERVKLFRSLSQKKYRQLHGLYMIHGYKLLEEALKSEVLIEALLFEESRTERVTALLGDSHPAPGYLVSKELYGKICGANQLEEVAAVVHIPRENRVRGERLLALDGIRDPGNMGTILRSAEAFGYQTILLLNDCVDVFSPKVARSSMGSLFRLSIFEAGSTDLEAYIQQGFELITSSLEAEELLPGSSKMTRHILVIGSESHGVSDGVMDLSTRSLKIPMEGEVESLNAAIAASILMYSLRLQEGESPGI